LAVSHCDLLSFPTRRSSDLSATMWLVLGGLFVAEAVRVTGLGGRFAAVLFGRFTTSYVSLVIAIAIAGTVLALFMPATVGRILRSEEHTSELQSQSNLVCRL